MGTLLQMVEQNHEQAEEGHERLRLDMRKFEADLVTARAENAALRAEVAGVKAAPVRVEKMTFSAAQLTAVVGAAIVMAGGMWQLKVGIDGLQTAFVNSSKLQDERNATNKEALDELRRAIEMRRVEIQNLSNYIQQNVAPKTPRGERE